VVQGPKPLVRRPRNARRVPSSEYCGISLRTPRYSTFQRVKSRTSWSCAQIERTYNAAVVSQWPRALTLSMTIQKRANKKGRPESRPLCAREQRAQSVAHSIGACEGERIARIRNRGAAIGTRNDVLSCARSLSGHGIGPPVQPNKASSTDERLLDLRATVAATTVQSLARESLLASLARR
jgi:hypothetical protein